MLYIQFSIYLLKDIYFCTILLTFNPSFILLDCDIPAFNGRQGVKIDFFFFQLFLAVANNLHFL